MKITYDSSWWESVLCNTLVTADKNETVTAGKMNVKYVCMVKTLFPQKV